ncbi:MAG: DUF1294 domain-containing protein [Eubacteriales bacterium]|nr:DUF1294 domain-containing protein [Eubacteriales bacterium]
MLSKAIIIYLLCMNVLGFLVMAADKQKARKKAWRIPEKVLFGIAIIGGSIGSWLGMYVFHHKTKHLRFIIGMPLIVIIQIVLGFVIVF